VPPYLAQESFFNAVSSSVYRPAGEPATAAMASEDIAKLAETLAKTQVAGGQLSFKGKGLKLNTAEDGKFLGRLGGWGWRTRVCVCVCVCVLHMLASPQAF
jgi:hypothetical protein